MFIHSFTVPFCCELFESLLIVEECTHQWCSVFLTVFKLYNKNEDLHFPRFLCTLPFLSARSAKILIFFVFLFIFFLRILHNLKIFYITISKFRQKKNVRIKISHGLDLAWHRRTGLCPLNWLPKDFLNQKFGFGISELSRGCRGHKSTIYCSNVCFFTDFRRKSVLLLPACTLSQGVDWISKDWKVRSENSSDWVFRPKWVSNWQKSGTLLTWVCFESIPWVCFESNRLSNCSRANSW